MTSPRMWTKLLKKHGFYKEKGKPIFTRHTLGNGGIYVTKINDGYLINIRDIYTQIKVSNASGLRRVIECCNRVNESESIVWKHQVNSI